MEDPSLDELKHNHETSEAAVAVTVAFVRSAILPNCSDVPMPECGDAHRVVG